MSTIQAVVIDPQVPQRLALHSVEAPIPSSVELLVRVEAISLNRGEVAFGVFGGKEGARIGWDFAGTVEQAAADGSGPAAGSRVVGLSSGSWAELIAVQARDLAVLPESVSFTQAATLPIAGAIAGLRIPLLVAKLAARAARARKNVPIISAITILYSSE